MHFGLVIFIGFSLNGFQISHDPFCADIEIAKNNFRLNSSDTISVPSFKLELHLSDSVKSLIEQIDAEISIHVMFKEIPKDSSNEDYLNYGDILIGDHLVIVNKGETSITIDDAFVLKSELDLLVDPNFEVLINLTAFSDQRVGNLISSTTIQEPINTMAGKTFDIDIKVIGEK